MQGVHGLNPSISMNMQQLVVFQAEAPNDSPETTLLIHETLRGLGLLRCPEGVDDGGAWWQQQQKLTSHIEARHLAKRQRFWWVLKLTR